MCSYSRQCVEESTVLTQGRIILWARGSLANDGSTVSKLVFLYSSVCGLRYVFLFSTIVGGKQRVLTQGRIILWAGGSLANDGSTVSKQVFLYSTVRG